MGNWLNYRAAQVAAIGGVFDRDVAELGIGVLGEAGHVNVSRRVLAIFTA